MNRILHLLTRLDELYHEGNLDAYEQRWQEAALQIERLCPGFSLAYAEIYNAGAKRMSHGGMRHVLLPTERNAK
jgi:hypothetical protein